MYRKPSTVTAIKVRKLESVGNLVRMSDDRADKYVFRGKRDGRKAGRPN
jgi:hypothetical protein